MLKRLARLSDVTFADVAPPQSVQLVVRGEVAALPLAGIVDIAAEQARLSKELQKIAADVAKVDAKLGNADFVARAPQEVIEEQRERRDEAMSRGSKLKEALARLQAGRGRPCWHGQSSAECRDAVAACHAVFGGAFTREQPEIFHGAIRLQLHGVEGQPLRAGRIGDDHLLNRAIRFQPQRAEGVALRTVNRRIALAHHVHEDLRCAEHALDAGRRVAESACGIILGESSELILNDAANRGLAASCATAGEPAKAPARQKSKTAARRLMEFPFLWAIRGLALLSILIVHR